MDAAHEYFSLLSDGDEATIASTREWRGARQRHDVVGTCPPSRLNELAQRFPELLDEIIRRRPEVQQA